MVKKYISLIILLLCILAISIGCGRDETDDYEEPNHQEEAWNAARAELEAAVRQMTGEDEDWAELFIIELPEDPEKVITLTIHAHIDYEIILRQAAYEMNETWVAMGKDYVLSIEIEDYTWFNFEEAYRRLNVELMAGMGPDLKIVGPLSPWDWVRSGLFTDIYQLIDNDPRTNRDDFYTNILEAIEYNGRLYIFPLSFGFEYVAINASLPQHLIDRFMQFDEISVRELMAIYADLKTMYSRDFGHLRISNSGTLSHLSVMLPYAMAPFIDFDNGTANLTDERFISFLYQFQQTFTISDLFQYRMSAAAPIANQNTMYEVSHLYVFYIENLILGPINAFFTPVNPFFLYYIPIVCEGGRLRLDYTFGGSTWESVIIPAAGNGALAWEFTQHLINAMANPFLQSQTVLLRIGNESFATPIKRELFEPRMRLILERTLYTYAQPFIGMDDESSREYQINNALERLAILNERAVTVPPPLGSGAVNIEIIEQLLLGIITPEEAAQRFHNQITLWLMEIS